jgi:hypothetical protein
MAWKKFAEKTVKIMSEIMRSAVALCFPNILEGMVLENINMSSDRNRATDSVV